MLNALYGKLIRLAYVVGSFLFLLMGCAKAPAPSSSGNSVLNQLSSNLQSALVSAGLTAAQASAVVSSANAAAASAGLSLRSLGAGMELEDATAQISTVTPSFTQGAISALSALAPDDATKLALEQKISSAVTTALQTTALANHVSSADQANLYQAMTQAALPEAAAQVSPDNAAMAASYFTQPAVAALGSAGVPADDMANFTSAFSSGASAAIPSMPAALSTAQKAALLQNAVQGVIAGPSTDPKLQPSDFANIAQKMTAAAISTLGSKASLSPADLQAFAQKIAQAPAGAMGSFTSLSAADQERLLSSASQGLTSGVASLSSLSVAQMQTMAQTISSSGVAAVSNITNDPKKIAQYAQAFAQGPVAALGSFSSLSESERQKMAQFLSQGATQGIAGIPGLSPSQIQTLTSSVGSGLTAALGTVVTDPAKMSQYVQQLSGGMVAGVTAFSGKDDTFKSQLAQMAVSGATQGLSNLSLSSGQLSVVAGGITAGAMAQLGAVVADPTKYSAYVSAMNTGATNALGAFSTLSTADKEGMVQAFSQYAVAGLGQVRGLSGDQISSLSSSITAGLTTGLNGVVKPSDLGTFVQNIGSGATAGIGQIPPGAMSDAQRLVASQSFTTGATTALGSIPGLRPTDITSIAGNLTTGITSGLKQAGFSANYNMAAATQNILTSTQNAMVGAGVPTNTAQSAANTLAQAANNGLSQGGFSNIDATHMLDANTPTCNAACAQTASQFTPNNTVYFGFRPDTMSFSLGLSGLGTPPGGSGNLLFSCANGANVPAVALSASSFGNPLTPPAALALCHGLVSVSGSYTIGQTTYSVASNPAVTFTLP